MSSKWELDDGIKSIKSAWQREHTARANLEKMLENAEAENDKLRELLTDLAICACGKYCYGCPHQYDGCDRDQRLRELGVEVDA